MLGYCRKNITDGKHSNICILNQMKLEGVVITYRYQKQDKVKTWQMSTTGSKSRGVLGAVSSREQGAGSRQQAAGSRADGARAAGGAVSGCCGTRSYRFSYLIVARYERVRGRAAIVVVLTGTVRRSRRVWGSVICGGRSWARGGGTRARRRAAGRALAARARRVLIAARASRRPRT